ncbi:6-N-hydroxylaminopurine resistance protein [Klebsiella oxytoca]|nr:6-N-hydroxylaminopurine resistance protein [Klebsiella oxytoca]
MPFDDEQYHRLLSAAGLSVSWSRTMQKRRLSGKIENNSRRLWGEIALPCAFPDGGALRLIRATRFEPGLAKRRPGNQVTLVQRQPQG